MVTADDFPVVVIFQKKMHKGPVIIYVGGGRVGGGKNHGVGQAYFFREKGWAKREFHNDWGWVIVCFVKNHTHYNSCGRSK